jgi:hypothetical protein
VGGGQVCANSVCARYTPVDTNGGPEELLDHKTQLTWMKYALGSPTKKSLPDAETACPNGTRLPNLGELQSLIDYGYSPTLDVFSFPNTPSGLFWTSTASSDPLYQMTVDFSNGGSPSLGNASFAYVRCVR